MEQKKLLKKSYSTGNLINLNYYDAYLNKTNVIKIYKNV